MSPERRRRTVDAVRRRLGPERVSERRVCRVLGQSRGTQRYAKHCRGDEGGALRLIFEESPWDSLISFDPGIPVSLGGALELNFADDVDVPSQVGRTHHIFDWTGVEPEGEFSVSRPYVWDLSHLYTTGDVTLLAVPEPTSLLQLSLCALAPGIGAVWRGG